MLFCWRREKLWSCCSLLKPWKETSGWEELIIPEEDGMDDPEDIALCAQFFIPAPYLLLIVLKIFTITMKLGAIFDEVSWFLAILAKHRWGHIIRIRFGDGVKIYHVGVIFGRYLKGYLKLPVGNLCTPTAKEVKSEANAGIETWSSDCCSSCVSMEYTLSNFLLAERKINIPLLQLP